MLWRSPDVRRGIELVGGRAHTEALELGSTGEVIEQLVRPLKTVRPNHFVELLTVSAGSAIVVYAVTRDAANNFVASVAAAWSLQSITGGVVAGDLVPSDDSLSAVVNG